MGIKYLTKNYYTTIGERVATKGGNSNNDIHQYLNKIPRNNTSVFLTPCNSNELSKLINKLPNKLSSGYDDISNKLLKEIFPEISEPLLNIFNDSLAQGIFPDAMKQADVVPLYKSGSHHISIELQAHFFITHYLKIIRKSYV